jgi:threonine/homoserine/homoserine lactone efflux protein
VLAARTQLMDDSLVTFALASLAIAATPGASWSFVISVVLQHDLRWAAPAIAGNATGIICHAALAAVGAASLLLTYRDLLHWLQLLGAAYLMLLGLKVLFPGKAATPTRRSSSAGSQQVFTQGVLVNLLNPKVPLLMLAMLPQTVSADTSHPTGRMFLVGTLHALIATAMLSLVAVATARLHSSEIRMFSGRAVLRICAAALILSGTVMALAAIRGIAAAR